MARLLLVPVVLLLGCAASPTPASPGAAPTSPAVVAATIGGGVSILAENSLITTVAKGNVAATLRFPAEQAQYAGSCARARS